MKFLFFIFIKPVWIACLILIGRKLLPVFHLIFYFNCRSFFGHWFWCRMLSTFAIFKHSSDPQVCLNHSYLHTDYKPFSLIQTPPFASILGLSIFPCHPLTPWHNPLSVQLSSLSVLKSNPLPALRTFLLFTELQILIKD